jgi:hypothetical protein
MYEYIYDRKQGLRTPLSPLELKVFLKDVYIYTHMYTYIYMYVYVCIYTHVYLCIYVYISIILYRKQGLRTPLSPLELKVSLAKSKPDFQGLFTEVYKYMYIIYVYIYIMYMYI